MQRHARGQCPKCGTFAVSTVREGYMGCNRKGCEHVGTRHTFVQYASPRGGLGSTEKTIRQSIPEEDEHYREYHVSRPYGDPFDPRDEDPR